jgi:hypothetical protein
VSTDPDIPWTIVYEAPIEKVPQAASLESLLPQLADRLLTTIAPDSAGWRLPFRLEVEGWWFEYRVEPAARRIIVTQASPISP